MENVYELCPCFENERFYLRLISEKDLADLLEVYSDKAAVPLFNGDNCHGDDFYYATEQRMKQAIDFWIYSYNEKYFVRWTVIDKTLNKAIGTIELFHRDSTDRFDNCGLLRLDLRSDYENEAVIESILSLISEPTFDLFYCDKIATKAWKYADKRRAALKNLGFVETDDKLIGADGASYSDYAVLHKH